jgi:hypothetical protein
LGHARSPLSLRKGCILTVHRSQGASWTLRPLHVLNDRLTVGRAASWLTRSVSRDP